LKPQTTLLYHHRGSPEVLHNVLLWWAKVDTRAYLVVRLDQDDPSLRASVAVIEEAAEEVSDEIALTAYIGEGGVDDAMELANELYSDDKDAHRGLVYVTSNAADLATFILTYESMSGNKRQ